MIHMIKCYSCQHPEDQCRVVIAPTGQEHRADMAMILIAYYHKFFEQSADKVKLQSEVTLSRNYDYKGTYNELIMEFLNGSSLNRKSVKSCPGV